MTKKARLMFLLIFLLCGFTRLVSLGKTFSLSTDLAQAFVIADKIINHNQIILLGYGPVQINIVAPTYHLIVSLLFYVLRNEFLVTLTVVLLSIFTVLVVYTITLKISGMKAALLASLLYAVSFELIISSKDLPHPMVMFSILLSLYLLFNGVTHIKPKHLVLSFLFFLFSLMYISTYLFIPVYLLTYLSVTYSFHKIHEKKSLTILFAATLLLVVFYLPVFTFHYFKNFKEFTNIPSMITVGNETFRSNPISVLSSAARHMEGFAKGFFQNPSERINILLFFFAMTMTTVTTIRKVRASHYVLILGLLFIFGILLSGLYPGQVFMHRLLVFFPVFIILVAISFVKLIQLSRSKTLLVTVFIISIIYIYHNLKNFTGYLFSKNHVVDHQQKVADFIVTSTQNKPYSILTLTPDEQTGYYSLEYIYSLKKKPVYQIPVRMDLRGELHYNFNPQKDILFLICKGFSETAEGEQKCLDVFLYKYGQKQIKNQQTIDSAKIYVFKNKN